MLKLAGEKRQNETGYWLKGEGEGCGTRETNAKGLAAFGAINMKIISKELRDKRNNNNTVQS